MNRREYRIKLIEIIYQNLLLKKDFNILIQDNLAEIPVDIYFKKILSYIIKNKNSIITEINPFLNKWEFDRLNYVVQAILVLAISEFKHSKNDNAIIINEAVELTKIYCSDDDYKFVNALLDNYAK